MAEQVTGPDHEQIERALERLFKKHRIVFWEDPTREMRDDYASTSLPDVTCVKIDRNEFALKYRMLRAEPHEKFLLYLEGPKPDPHDDWLLDVRLASGAFRADKVSLWLAELGLPLDFLTLATAHKPFFEAKARRDALKALLDGEESSRTLQRKMMAVCVKAEPRLDAILEALLDSLAQDDEEPVKLLERCGLEAPLWQLVAQEYGYAVEQPGLKDFAIRLFRSAYARALGEGGELNGEALLLLRRWKDSRSHADKFAILSTRFSEPLGIEQGLEVRPYRSLGAVDLFEVIDRKVLSGLSKDVAARTITADDCADVIRLRRSGHWYRAYQAEYEAIATASRFHSLLDQVDLTIPSFDEGLQRYASTWFQVDQLYRQFITLMRRSGQTSLLKALYEQVENGYVNSYVLALNDRWQAHVDGATAWTAVTVKGQRAFHAEHVQPVLARKSKLFVLISDALRYEIADELQSRLREMGTLDSDLTAQLGVLPSFTQLGMASLLPHSTLALADDAAQTTLVDGQSAQGLENRRKILAKAHGGRATALGAEELLGYERESTRALIRENDVVYVYHNRIDAVGDKRDSEEKVFDAVDDAINDLVKLVKKLTSDNANILVITTDHGFLYQHRPLDDSDFASQDAQGDRITVTNRRFVLGTGLSPSKSFKHFRAPEVGLEGATEMLLPKSINRLRVQGAGSRYVHGGAALQEVVLPVLTVRTRPKQSVRYVDVQMLQGNTAIISTNQLTVVLYQTEPVDDERRALTVRLGIYTEGGMLISDERELTFDYTSTTAREREQRVTLRLSKQADAANNQEVTLRMEQRVEGTFTYTPYRTLPYTLRRSFSSDFDF